MSDIFDTRFEGKKVEIDDGLVHLGEEINLYAKDPALRHVLVGSGWDVNAFTGQDIDVDLSMILLDKTGQTREDSDFVFYNQPEAQNGAVKHHGDSRSGAGDGDDEVMTFDTHGVSYEIQKVLFVISIYKGYEREQTLDQVRNGYVRIANADTKNEICRYNIDKILDDHQECAVVIGEMNREGPKWHFKPLADFEKSLGDVARRYGLIINQE